MDVYDLPNFKGGILLTEMAAPSTPASGTMAMFVGTDGYLYVKNDSGTVWGIRPPPQYARQSTALSTLTTSYASYTGRPSISVVVPNSGMLKVTAGLKGVHTTGGSSVRVAVSMTGANTIDPGTTAGDTGGVVMYGGGSSTKHQVVQRTTIHTGLTPGSTTVALEGRTSNATGETLDESWLIVQPIP